MTFLSRHTSDLQNNLFYYSALLFALTLTLSRAAVSFFIIWFILLFLFQGHYRTTWILIRKNRALQAMGAFLAFLFASILWSDDTHEALNQIRLYSYWIIIPILAVSLKKEWLPNIITAFLAGMLVSEILTYGIFFDFWSINGHTSDDPSPFMTRIHYSIFLATAAIILLNRLLSNRYSYSVKIPLLVFFITTAINLFISNGRTGQLAFLVAIAVTVIIHYRLTLKSLFLFAVLTTTLFVGAYTAIPHFQKRIDSAITDTKMLQQGNFDTSWGLRAAFWIVTKDILIEHPLTGIGIGDYKHAAADAVIKNHHNFSPRTIAWCSDMHYHNQYLMILAQSGVIGFFLMLWLLVELFRLKIADRELKEFSVLGLSIFIVGFIAEPLWMLQFPIILFVFIVSISLAASFQVSAASKENNVI
ncbi:MAG TPA: O-antigen ligase family protein [Sulfuricurvum sp.]|nr:O-antigen ligase family protein [Sulfuricurvum sp.]